MLNNGGAPGGKFGHDAIVVHPVEERDAAEVDTDVGADAHRPVLAPENLHVPPTRGNDKRLVSPLDFFMSTLLCMYAARACTLACRGSFSGRECEREPRPPLQGVAGVNECGEQRRRNWDTYHTPPTAPPSTPPQILTKQQNTPEYGPSAPWPGQKALHGGDRLGERLLDLRGHL